MLEFLSSLFPKRRIDGHGRSVWVASDRGMVVVGLLGWTIWIIAIAVRIFGTTRRIIATGSPAGAQVEYFDSIHHFWAGAPLYIPGNLHGFYYLPIMLILFTPLTWVGLPVAGAALSVISAAFLSWSVHSVVRGLGLAPNWPLTGAVLALVTPPAFFNLLALQLQLAMTAALLAGTAAGMRGKWQEMALWLILATAIKPLAIVMVCLCAAAIPRTRYILAGSLILLLVAPYAVCNSSYLSAEYINYLRQLWHITSAVPGAWPYQADFSTLLSALGLDLEPGTRLFVRIAAALATLILALRIAALSNSRAIAFGLYFLSACFIGLFNPRQEDISFIVVAPAPAVLAVTILHRNGADWRGWSWLLLALLIGLQWGANIAPWVLPGVMILIWLGLIGMSIDTRRWCAWFQNGGPDASQV